jgi:hypothetical protein
MNNVQRYAEKHGFAPERPGKILADMLTHPERDELGIAGKIDPLALTAKGIKVWDTKETIVANLTKLQQSATRQDITMVMPSLLEVRNQPHLANTVANLTDDEMDMASVLTFKVVIERIIEWLES